MNLTLAITVFNRWELLLESFDQVIDDSRIDEILISDDASDIQYWNKIKELPKFNPKIKVIRQLENRGMSVNKKDAVFHSKNEWVILFDSDNVIGKDYLDAFYKTFEHNKCELINSVIFCPSFAKPQFDYRKYQNRLYGKYDKPPLNEPMCNCLFNTANYVVKRSEYLTVWEENKEMKASDTIWMNYLWIRSGRVFAVVEGMHYFHRVHKDSGFLQEVDYNMKKAEEIKKLILEL